ncbi:hypothetical protein ACOSQ2_004592 [Xanthoceras sorbifolium]
MHHMARHHFKLYSKGRASSSCPSGTTSFQMYYKFPNDDILYQCPWLSISQEIHENRGVGVLVANTLKVLLSHMAYADDDESLDDAEDDESLPD